MSRRKRKIELQEKRKERAERRWKNNYNEMGLGQMELKKYRTMYLSLERMERHRFKPPEEEISKTDYQSLRQHVWSSRLEPREEPFE